MSSCYCRPYLTCMSCLFLPLRRNSYLEQCILQELHQDIQLLPWVCKNEDSILFVFFSPCCFDISLIGFLEYQLPPNNHNVYLTVSQGHTYFFQTFCFNQIYFCSYFCLWLISNEVLDGFSESTQLVFQMFKFTFPNPVNKNKFTMSLLQHLHNKWSF